MTTNNSSTHFEQRIDLLAKELASKRRSVNWFANLSLVVGILVLLTLGGYFGYGYNELNSMTKPDQILAAASNQLNEYSEEARKFAAVEVRKFAPLWAEEASLKLIQSLPSLREKTEESLAQFFDNQLQSRQKKTRREFAMVLRDNRDDFENAINIIVEQNDSSQFVDQVMPIIEKNYGAELKANVGEALSGLREANRRIVELAQGKDLNLIEQQQRQILGLLRLLRGK